MQKNWLRALWMWPGQRVLLMGRSAIITRRLSDWNVEVVTDYDGQREIWWRGNLRLVL